MDFIYKCKKKLRILILSLKSKCTGRGDVALEEVSEIRRLAVIAEVYGRENLRLIVSFI
jgi:hypothetical protein